MIRASVLALTCVAVVGLTQCRNAVTDTPVTVSWSTAGLPPTYVERRWRAEVPSALQPELQALVRRTRFFDLPEDLGGNPPEGRDMGSYSITIAMDGRTHTVRFSDATATNDLAELRAWLGDKLGAQAAAN